MTKSKISVAAAQMLGEVKATDNRLNRATNLVQDAAKQGANLVLLPELFNTGYAYSSANYYRAETLEGPTATWMRETAAAHNIHLAGSLLLLDQNEVFNAMLLFAPNGRMWRYDKNYPWAWERAYFRNGSGITIADTDLGRIGLLICWDVAHTNLWQQYAGQVDLMLISSCPPDAGRLAYILPDGRRFDPSQVAPVAAKMNDQADKTFGPTIDKQVRWLKVPAIHASSTGHFQSAVPQSKASLLAAAAMMPGVITKLPKANQIQVTCDFAGCTKILDSGGNILNQISAEAGEGITIAEIALSEKRPRPTDSQPPIALMPLTYAFSDYVLPWLTIPQYRQGVRRAWGQHMAPIDPATRQRAIDFLIISALILLVAFLSGRRRSVTID